MKVFVLFLLIAALIAMTNAACSGLDEESCLSSTSDSCCVWCAKPSNQDGKCVSAGSPKTASCGDALSTHCASPEFVAASCFCCTQCASAPDKNVAHMQSKALALLTPLAAVLVGAVARRGVVLVLIIALLAMVNSAEAFSVFDSSSSMMRAGQTMFFSPLAVDAVDAVSPRPLYRYRAIESFADLQSRAVQPFDIQEMSVQASVSQNYARTVVTSVQKNEADDSQVAVFVMNIPENSFVSGLTIVVGNKRFLGKVVEREVAEQMFAEAIASGQTAGLLSSRGTSEFAVSMNTAAKETATFEVTLEELLQRRLGLYTYLFNLNPGQVVARINVEISLYHSSGIDQLAWSHAKQKEGIVSTETFDDKKRVVLKYTPDEESQSMSEFGLAEDIEVSYAVAAQPSVGQVTFAAQGQAMSTNHAEMMVQNVNNTDVMQGDDEQEQEAKSIFFMHQFSAPNWITATSSAVVFIVDVSGSMSGTKIEQAAAALKLILGELHPTDRFGIVLFDDEIVKFEQDVIYATSQNVQKAQQFVDDRVVAGGGTFISGGMEAGADMLRARSAAGGDVPILVLLTDGHPSVGLEGKELRDFIVDVTKGEQTVYTLGFGFNLDFTLLEGIAADTDGFARRIYVDEDAADQLTGFYAEIATALLTDVIVTYEPQGVVDNLSRTAFQSLFKGSELVVTGEVTDPTIETFTAVVTGKTCGCEVSWSRSFVVNTTQPALINAEKVWAFVTIKQLLQRALIEERVGEVDLGEHAGPKIIGIDTKKSAKQESIDMALKYQFVTPYTSLITVAEDEEENDQDETEATVTATGTFAGSSAAGNVGGKSGGSRGVMNYGPIATADRYHAVSANIARLSIALMMIVIAMML